MEAKVEGRIKGELENFAKDVIEYYQKTGLTPSPSTPIVAKRIAEISFKAGYDKGKTENNAAEYELCRYIDSKVSQAKQAGIREVGVCYEKYLRSFGASDDMIKANTWLQTLLLGELPN